MNFDPHLFKNAAVKVFYICVSEISCSEPRGTCFMHSLGMNFDSGKFKHRHSKSTFEQIAQGAIIHVIFETLARLL